MLQEHGGKGLRVLENLKKLAYERNQVELLESGAYHPIFPLIPQNDVIKQLELNKEIKKRVFGQNYKPLGIFPPELALDSRQIEIFSRMGYKYSLVSEYAVNGIGYNQLPFIKIHGERFFIIRRIRYLSNDLGFRHFHTISEFVNSIRNFSTNKNSVAVIGMDWETFGEHHTDYIDFLIQGLSNLETITLTEYITHMTDAKSLIEIKEEDIIASSWSTDPQDIEHKIPYPLWDHPKNTLHNLILTLLDILEQAIGLVDKKDIPINFYKSQQSCQLWWCARTGAPDLIKRATTFQVDTLEELSKRIEKYSSERKKAIGSLLFVAKKLNQKILTLIDLN